MKKVERQRLVKQLITQNDIETQEELIAKLEAEGVRATQATISRDIREMSIVKTHGVDGRIKYAIFSQKEPSSSEEKLKSSLKDTVIRMERIQFMTIIHTEMGGADVVANFLDEVSYDDVAGTVAGVDTIIIISRSNEEAQVFLERMEAMIH